MVKNFTHLYCVKSTVLRPGRTVKIVYLRYSLQLLSALKNQCC